MSYATVDEAMKTSILAVDSWDAAKALKENAHGIYVCATLAEEDARIVWERSRNDVISALLIERRDASEQGHRHG